MHEARSLDYQDRAASAWPSYDHFVHSFGFSTISLVRDSNAARLYLVGVGDYTKADQQVDPVFPRHWALCKILRLSHTNEYLPRNMVMALATPAASSADSEYRNACSVHIDLGYLVTSLLDELGTQLLGDFDRIRLIEHDGHGLITNRDQLT